MRVTLGTILLSLATGPLLAQGLPSNPLPNITDCSKAYGVDRTFCDSRTLLAAEAEVARLYEAVRKATPMWFTMSTKQEWWKVSTRRPPATAGSGFMRPDFRAAYSARAKELESLQQSTAALLALSKKREEIDATCVAPPITGFETFMLTCQVEKVIGIANNLIAQRQEWDGPGGRWTKPFDTAIPGSTSLVVFEQDETDPQSYRPVAWLDEIEGSIGEPVRSEGPAGTFITLPRTGGGNGGLTNDVVIRRLGPLSWREVDAQSWRDEARRRLPTGLTPSGTETPDLANLAATLSLSRPTDATCCPSGGSAEVLLELKDDRLRITGMTIRPAPRSTPPARQQPAPRR